MNSKPLFATVTLVLLICLALPAEITQANIGYFSTGNLLLNGGFENGDYLPASWLPDSWAPGAVFIWDDTQSTQGNRSIKISLATANDARWVQGVTVRPDTDYRLSGWIKTENVAHTSETADVGASLSVYGPGTHTAGLIGTHEWTNVSMTFNSGSSSRIGIAARLGYWSGTTTGTAWFDGLKLEPVNPSPPLTNPVFLPLINKSPCVSTSPGWKILLLVYESTDFSYTDGLGQPHHLVATITQTEKDKVAYAATRFANGDVPALNSCTMRPTVTIRYLPQPLSNLSPMGCNDYAPSPSDTASDRDPAFDSVITIWDGSGTDLLTGQSMSIQGCAWAWGMGTGQTYDAIFVDYVQYIDRNVFKHEWGHSILFYYDAAGTAPRPPVDNHINDCH